MLAILFSMCAYGKLNLVGAVELFWWAEHILDEMLPPKMFSPSAMATGSFCSSLGRG